MLQSKIGCADWQDAGRSEVTMQRIQRLILTVVGALALLLASPFPQTAWASHFTLSSNPEWGYSQLSAAASDATDGDTIFMTEDSSGNDCYIVQTPYQGNKNLTLDLGGHTLTVGGYKNNVADYYGINMEIGSITIKNGTILSTSNHPDPINAVGGTIILSDDVKVESRTSVIQAANGGKVIVDGAQVVSTSAAYCAAFAKDPGSSIELRSGSISQTSTGPGLTLPPVVLSVKDGASATISGGSLYSGSSTAMVATGTGSLITVTGGKVSNDGKDGLKSGVNGYWAGEATDGGRIYLKGGEVSSDYGNGLYALGNNSGGTIEVSGGTLSVGTTGYALLAGGSASSGSAATVSDGSLRGKVGVGAGDSDAGTSSLTITGGTVDGEVTKSAGTITVSGGIFSEGLNEAYCAEGYGTISTHNQAKPEEVRVVRSWDVTVEPIPDQTYKGSALTPKPVVKLNDDGSEVPDDEYELVYDDNVDVGTAKVTITHLAADGSDAMAEATFKVVARPALAKAADVTKTYGQEDPTFAATLEAVDGKAESGLVEGHVATIAVGRAEGEDVGSHQLKLENVSISDADGRDVTANYQVDESGLGALGVLPHALTFTWPSDDALSFTYDGTLKTVLPTANTVNGDVITLTCEGNSATEVGDYVARVTGFSGDKAANYWLADDEPTASCAWRILKGESGPAAQVFGYTLTLDGRIGMNTYMVLSDGIVQNPENYQGEYWYGGEVVASTKVSDIKPVRRSTPDGTAYTVYRFPVTSVAKDADAKFAFKIRDLSADACLDFASADGKTTIAGDEGLAYSIVDYLDDRIANSESPEMRQLARDLKAYHVFAKHYFAVRDKGSTERLPDVSSFVDFQEVSATDLADYKYTAPGNIEHFTYKGTTLDLLTDTSFRLYFASDDPSVLTITCAGSELAPVKNGGMWYVEVTGIASRDIDKMYDITISNGSQTATAHHGPLGYALWALSTEATSAQREALQRTMMALYHYNQSAKAYFANLNN